MDNVFKSAHIILDAYFQKKSLYINPGVILILKVSLAFFSLKSCHFDRWSTILFWKIPWLYFYYTLNHLPHNTVYWKRQHYTLPSSSLTPIDCICNSIFSFNSYVMCDVLITTQVVCVRRIPAGSPERLEPGWRASQMCNRILNTSQSNMHDTALIAGRQAASSSSSLWFTINIKLHVSFHPNNQSSHDPWLTSAPNCYPRLSRRTYYKLSVVLYHIIILQGFSSSYVGMSSPG